MVAHNFNPSTPEAGGSLRVQGQPGLSTETVSQKQRTKQKPPTKQNKTKRD